MKMQERREDQPSPKLSRDGAISFLDLSIARIVISYANHDERVHSDQLPEGTQAIFIEAPGNWVASANSFDMHGKSADYGPILKKARSLGIPLIDTDPLIVDSAKTSDTVRLAVDAGLSIASFCAAGHLVVKGAAAKNDPMSRRGFFGAAGALSLSAAYFGLPVAGVAGRVLSCREDILHDTTAALLRSSDAIGPATLMNMVRFRNAVMAFKQLSYLEQIRGQNGQPKPTAISLLGSCHSGMEMDLQKPRSQLLTFLNQFELKEILQIPETFYSMRINRADGGTEVTVFPALKEMFNRR